MKNVSMTITGNFEEIEWTAYDVQTGALPISAIILISEIICSSNESAPQRVYR